MTAGIKKYLTPENVFNFIDYITSPIKYTLIKGGEVLYSLAKEFSADPKKFMDNAIQNCKNIVKVLKFSTQVSFDAFKQAATTMYAHLKTEIGTQFGYSVADWLAYNVGVVAFEVLLGVISRGTSVGLRGAKIAAKLAEYFKQADNLMAFVNNFMDGLAGLKNTAQGKWCKLMRGGCFIGSTPILKYSNESFSNPSLIPICEIQLFNYVSSHKSLKSDYILTGSNNRDYIFDKDLYLSDQQKLRDKYDTYNGIWYDVEFKEVIGTSICKLALHEDWINKHGYNIGNIVSMNLTEQGISGPFKIVSLKRIYPQKKPLDEDQYDEWVYMPVTGIFIHESNQLLELQFDNNEKLFVTENHPIFSTSKSSWTFAVDLKAEDKVLTKQGELKVVSINKFEGVHKVYNLEVKNLHNFLVGNIGIVVHNVPQCFKSNPFEIFGDFTRENLGKINIFEGTNKKGLVHILQRHHPEHYPEMDKGDLFPEGTTLGQIVKGIQEVGTKGTRKSLPENARQTFEKRIKVNGESANYRLVVDKISNEVITFFKIGQ